jgi:Acetyltransferase (GNAT) domain
VLALADRNLLMPLQGREARYRKYYERNPLGAPVLFLAREEDSRELVGMSTLFPTRLRVFGELVPAAIGGDFAVDDGHRGFGPSVALQRASVGALAERGLACAFGYPNEFSEPITKRVGYVDVGRLTRFVKVLRSRAVLDAYAGSRPLARAAAPFGRVLVDPLLAARDRLRRRPRGLRVERPDRFDERFESLWEALWREHGITSERNAELLNWKYEMGEPGGIYRVLAVVGEDDDVAGYAVFRVRNEIRHLVDVAFMPVREVLDALLSAVVRDSRAGGATAITTLYLGPATLLTERLRAFGFVRRVDESGLRVYVPGESELDRQLVDPDNWYFLTGDADV